MLKVIAGTCRGKILKSLKGDHTRPSSGRMKEAVFSMLGSAVPGSRFLDLFAGSGQMGLEAASRGASSVLMAERDPAAFSVLLANTRACALPGVKLRKIDAFRLVTQLLRAGERFDLIYFDPPWREEEQLLQKCLPLLSGLLREDGLLLIETENEQPRELAEGMLEWLKACRQGRSMVFFYSKKRQGAVPGDDEESDANLRISGQL